jgi:hypothetical protein
MVHTKMNGFFSNYTSDELDDLRASMISGSLPEGFIPQSPNSSTCEELASYKRLFTGSMFSPWENKVFDEFRANRYNGESIAAKYGMSLRELNSLYGKILPERNKKDLDELNLRSLRKKCESQPRELLLPGMEVENTPEEVMVNHIPDETLSEMDSKLDKLQASIIKNASNQNSGMPKMATVGLIAVAVIAGAFYFISDDEESKGMGCIEVR